MNKNRNINSYTSAINVSTIDHCDDSESFIKPYEDNAVLVEYEEN